MDIRSPQSADMALPIQTEPARLKQLAENRELIHAVRTVNATDLMGEENELSFVFDRETQRPLIRVVNRKTKEVVLQVPPDYVLQLAKNLRAGNREAEE